jgi:thiol-disulfide isomerase/thioredoxin
MKRRNWILSGAGAAAGLAGLAWQARRGASVAAAHGASAEPARDHAAAANEFLWQTSFERPEGGTLAMATLLGNPLLLNFWATWCPPCIKEMPEIDRFASRFAASGGNVVGLAVDNPKAVRAFLARTPVHYAIALAGFEGTDLSRKLGNDSGALPFTALFDRQGNLTQRRLGTTSYDELVRWAAG